MQVCNIIHPERQRVIGFSEWMQRLIRILKTPKTVIVIATLFALANASRKYWTAATDQEFLVFDNLQPKQPLPAVIHPAQERRLVATARTCHPICPTPKNLFLLLRHHTSMSAAILKLLIQQSIHIDLAWLI
jgi:hypothetical protein